MDLQSIVPGRTLGPGLFSANAVYMVPEELTDEVPIGIQAFAKDRIARWTENSSSEESDEELPPVKPPRSIADRGKKTQKLLQQAHILNFVQAKKIINTIFKTW